MKRTDSNCPICDPAITQPGSIEMDRCVLSCMMQAPDFAVPLAMERLTPEDFYTEACGLLFDLITIRHADGKLVDPVSLTQVIYDRDLISKVGGPAFVSEVYTASPNPAHVSHYADQVKKSSRRRKLALISSRLAAISVSSNDDDWEAEASAEMRGAEIILSGGADSALKPLKDVARSYLDYYDAGPGTIDPPVKTGIAGLDAILGGGVRREYIVAGGKSGHGKTLLAMQLAGKLAGAGRAGLIVGYEMSNLQIFMRDIAREARVPLPQIMGREPFENPGTFQAVTRTISKCVEEWRIVMLDASHTTPEAIAAHARHLHRRGALDFIVIDYLQLVPVARAKGERRDEVLGELSAGFARLRKDLGCCIIAPVQLNDDGLIRDSRAILHPAECFLRIEMEEEENAETGEIEVGENGLIRVLKNRFGPSNKSCPVRRDGQFQTFTDREATRKGKKEVPRSHNQNWRGRAPREN